MIIKAVKFFEKGFYNQGFAMGGEDGANRFDPNVRYRGSLQNYVIDTGSEVILVDTGLPREMPAAKADLNAPAFLGYLIEDYVSALKTAGYTAEQVSKILITHKHADHSGEIRSFPNAEVYVNRIETMTDEMKIYPNLIPVDFTDGPYYNFSRSQIIAPGIRMIPAPGHTFGNSIIIVEEDDHFILFHGDITYTDEALYADRLSVVYDDIHQARSTQNLIRAFIKEHPTVYCGTHSPLGYENLEARKIMDLDHPPKTIWPDEADFVADGDGSGRYVCSICGYVYDPAIGDPANGIPAGTKFEELPSDWHCPRCRQGKDKFSEA